MEKDYINWSWYDFIVRKSMIKKIEEDKFKPDVVVGVMRGGMIPAIMISHHFDVPCLALPLSFRDHCDNKLDDFASIHLHNQNILYVEDIVDSGKTMGELQKYVEGCMNFYPAEKVKPSIKYAALWYNTSQPVKVDYFSLAFDRSVDDTWFVYPYEKDAR